MQESLDPILERFWTACHLPADRLPIALAQFERYRQLIEQGNQQTSLVAQTSLGEFGYKHVCDSLALLQAWPERLAGPVNLTDVGCGAGLPGIVLALVLPELHLTAIDSNHKKTEFVALAAGELGLAGRTNVVNRSSRELGHESAFAGRFDVVTARAVATADKLIKECRLLVRPGGCAIFYKTPAGVEQELPMAQREADKHKLTIQVSPIIDLPGEAGQRQFIRVDRAE